MRGRLAAGLLLVLAVPAATLAPAPALRRLHSPCVRSAQPLLSAAAAPRGGASAGQPRPRLRWPSFRLPNLGRPAGSGRALPGTAAAGLRRQGPVGWLLARLARITVLASVLLSLGGLPIAGRLHTPAVAAPGAVTVERVVESGRATAGVAIHALRRAAADRLPPSAGDSGAAAAVAKPAAGGGSGIRGSSMQSSGVQPLNRLARPATTLRALASAAPAVRPRLPPTSSTSSTANLAVRTRVQWAAGAVGSALADLQAHVSPDERDAMLLLATAALVAPIMGYFKLSPVLGFLAAGILLGPTGLGVVADVASTTKLAELGVVFFLFEMGLELEYERLKSVGRDAFRLGGAQFILTTAAFFGAASAAGFVAPAALVMGAGLALSSSAFVIQLLSEKGELATRFGRASFGILLFQDLAVVPLLVVTPLLGGNGAALGAALRLAAIKSASALAVIFVVGRLLLKKVFQLVASAKDQTAFLAITLLTVISMSAFTQALGLSDTLGAFLAGILLAETKYRYQIEADIAPFRGLLLGLFFITTGFSIDIPLALASAPLVLGLTVALHVTKTFITALVLTVNQLKPGAALRSGLLLSQGGEFAFVLFGLAQTHGLMPVAQVKLMLTVVVLSMFLTPFLNELGASLASRIEKSGGGLVLQADDDDDQGEYVLVCGFGRVGQAVCELLTARLVRYKAFDMDPYRVAEARELGLPVFYGDARRPDVLRSFMSHEEDITSVVVTLDDERDCTRAVRALRRLYPTAKDMPIFVRAVDEQHRRKLSASAATALETGPEESALMLGGAVLSSLGCPREEVLALIDDMRASMYSDRMQVIRDSFVERKPPRGRKKKDKKLPGDVADTEGEAIDVSASVAASGSAAAE